MHADDSSGLSAAGAVLVAFVVGFSSLIGARTLLAGGAPWVVVPATVVVAVGGGVVVGGVVVGAAAGPRSRRGLLVVVVVGVVVGAAWPVLPTVWTGQVEVVAALVLVALPRRVAVVVWPVLVTVVVSATAVRDGPSWALLYASGTALVSVAVAVPTATVRAARELSRTRSALVLAEAAVARAERFGAIAVPLDGLLSRCADDAAGAVALLHTDPAHASERFAVVARGLRDAHAQVRSFAREPAVVPPLPRPAAPRPPRPVRWCVGVAVPVAVTPVLLTAVGTPDAGPVAPLLVAVPVGALLLGLYGVLAVAAATGSRRWPRWPGLVALAAVAHLPVIAWGGGWSAAQLLFLAALVVSADGRTRVVLVAAAAVWLVLVPTAVTAAAGYDPATVVGVTGTACAGIGVVAALVLSTRMSALVLRTRAADARLVDAQRRRILATAATDLHDLLGQSLAAGALCADIGEQLALRDPAAARRHAVDLLTAIERAGEELALLQRTDPAPTVAGELRLAELLLATAGVAVRIEHGELGPLTPALRETISWTIREGATNVVRHSRATRCDIVLVADPPGCRLVIRNDGADAREPDASGTGLAALRRRATACGARLEHRRDGVHFELRLTARTSLAPAGPAPVPA